MKKIILFLPVILFACKDNTRNTSNKSEPVTADNSSLPINGSWNLVWENVNGKIRDDGKVTQFKMFNDGYFSLMMQDSVGNWIGGAGTYSLEGKNYKETFSYCTVPAYVGATDWQTCELKGDTLYFIGFTKAVYADGRDMTNNFPKFEERRVRAK